MPKLSVIVPIYGVEKYIERCARSLFEQTLEDIEYIFIDDCTLDKSIGILKRLIEEYRTSLKEKNYSVTIEKMPKNTGLPGVRKYGIQLATGEYVIHCDSDDWVDFDMYRLMYEKAKADDADVVSCGYIVHDGDRHLRQMKETPKVLKEDAIKQMMLQQTHWVLWNKLFKRSLYNNPLIYPTENMGEDMALSLQLMYYCNKMSYIDDDLYYYFYNRESLTNTKDEIASLKRFSQTHRNCELVYDFYSSKGDFKVYKKALEWLRRVVKMHIDKSTHKGKILWKSTYFHVEFKLLFNPLITNEQRKIVLRKILRR